MLRAPLRRRLVRGGLRAIGGAHRFVYRASGGRIGGRLHGMRILLLTTTGRRSGKPRTVPLTFIRDGERLVVIASNAGMPWPPAWWLNLAHNPRAVVQVERERRAVHAQPAAPPERARLWSEVTERFPVYARYQDKTTREIPVVILTPVGEPLS